MSDIIREYICEDPCDTCDMLCMENYYNNEKKETSMDGEPAVEKDTLSQIEAHIVSIMHQIEQLNGVIREIEGKLHPVLIPELPTVTPSVFATPVEIGPEDALDDHAPLSRDLYRITSQLHSLEDHLSEKVLYRIAL